MKGALKKRKFPEEFKVKTLLVFVDNKSMDQALMDTKFKIIPMKNNHPNL